MALTDADVQKQVLFTVVETVITRVTQNNVNQINKLALSS